MLACAGGVVVDTVVGVVVRFLVIAAHELNDVQERHLHPISARNPSSLTCAVRTACHPCQVQRLSAAV